MSMVYILPGCLLIDWTQRHHSSGCETLQTQRPLSNKSIHARHAKWRPWRPTICRVQSWPELCVAQSSQVAAVAFRHWPGVSVRTAIGCWEDGVSSFVSQFNPILHSLNSNLIRSMTSYFTGHMLSWLVLCGFRAIPRKWRTWSHLWPC